LNSISASYLCAKNDGQDPSNKQEYRNDAQYNEILKNKQTQ